jgi:hypothetical protein
MLKNSKKPTLTKVLISLYHDIKEDTDVSFGWLQETH